MMQEHIRPRTNLAEKVLELIELRSPKGFQFWLSPSSGVSPTEIPAQDHCDIVYSLYLAGLESEISPDAAASFVKMLGEMSLYARPTTLQAYEKTPGAHGTAYLLGAARLLEMTGRAKLPAAIFDGWKLDELIGADGLPKWPRAWSHHSWRVSHWIGGTASILLSLAGRNPAFTTDLVHRVIDACEQKIVDKRSGLLKAYKSDFIHLLFNTAYRIRHNPELGELGGVVHLLWVAHALKRDYVGAQSLYEASLVALKRQPFMEAAPYCLDFDIIQLARTSANDHSAWLVDRAKKLSKDTADFLLAPYPDTYTLHKLPGALATMHECALLTKAEIEPTLGIVPIDIIQKAYWI